MSQSGETRVREALKRAVERTEEALSEIMRIDVEEIRDGLESSNHVEAAEREMRSALRQLAMAERELNFRRPVRATFDLLPTNGPAREPSEGTGA